jgi:hypothetical protein
MTQSVSVLTYSPEFLISNLFLYTAHPNWGAYYTLISNTKNSPQLQLQTEQDFSFMYFNPNNGEIFHFFMVMS